VGAEKEQPSASVLEIAASRAVRQQPMCEVLEYWVNAKIVVVFEPPSS
jgi:hypothetical protein